MTCNLYVSGFILSYVFIIPYVYKPQTTQSMVRFEKDVSERIRLVTRILRVWFVKSNESFPRPSYLEP